jgi:hypothetical protein
VTVRLEGVQPISVLAIPRAAVLAVPADKLDRRGGDIGR